MDGALDFGLVRRADTVGQRAETLVQLSPEFHPIRDGWRHRNRPERGYVLLPDRAVDPAPLD